jgi:hypothetical protein
LRRYAVLLVLLLGFVGGTRAVLADGPSGSVECHVQDDDCDGAIDEDLPGDTNGDDDPDDDGDGSVDEDPAGDALDDSGENQVACADGQDVNGIKVYGDESGAEVCSDASETGPEGRIIVSGDQGGYVAADGDNTNPEPVNGYARLDSDGLHCGDDSNQDSTQSDQSQNTQEDCQPEESPAP